MAIWKITEKTMQCMNTGSVVTIILYGDGESRCTGHKKYVTNRNKHSKKILKKLSKKHGRELKCEGPLCNLVMEYREELGV